MVARKLTDSPPSKVKRQCDSNDLQLKEKQEIEISRISGG